MAVLPCLLLPWLLICQEPGSPPEPRADLHASLGEDSLTRIQLAPAGCWDGMLLGMAKASQAPAPSRSGEATVPVWDLLPPASQRRESFALYLATLRARLSKAWQAPPPSHQAIELSEFMAIESSSPQKLDQTKVKSMQDRFNRLPPSGSPVK